VPREPRRTTSHALLSFISKLGDTFMKSIRPHLFALVAGAALLAGCATPRPPNPAAEMPHCYKTN
jgi:hypothetical protein